MDRSELDGVCSVGRDEPAKSDSCTMHSGILKGTCPRSTRLHFSGYSTAHVASQRQAGYLWGNWNFEMYDHERDTKLRPERGSLRHNYGYAETCDQNFQQNHSRIWISTGLGVPLTGHQQKRHLFGHNVTRRVGIDVLSNQKHVPRP